MSLSSAFTNRNEWLVVVREEVTSTEPFVRTRVGTITSDSGIGRIVFFEFLQRNGIEDKNVIVGHAILVDELLQLGGESNYSFPFPITVGSVS